MVFAIRDQGLGQYIDSVNYRQAHDDKDTLCGNNCCNFTSNELTDWHMTHNFVNRNNLFISHFS